MLGERGRGYWPPLGLWPAEASGRAGAPLGASGAGDVAVHRRHGVVLTGLGVGLDIGLGEQPAGEDPLGGGMIPIACQPAARAGGPLPAVLTGAVGGWGVAERLAAAWAVLGGATRRHGDSGDAGLGGQVAHRLDHAAAHLSGQPSVARARSEERR